MKYTEQDALQDAYLAWVQGGAETRGFPTFAAWATYFLAHAGYQVTR